MSITWILSGGSTTDPPSDSLDTVDMFSFWSQVEDNIISAGDNRNHKRNPWELECDVSLLLSKHYTRKTCNKECLIYPCVLLPIGAEAQFRHFILWFVLAASLPFGYCRSQYLFLCVPLCMYPCEITLSFSVYNSISKFRPEMDLIIVTVLFRFGLDRNRPSILLIISNSVFMRCLTSRKHKVII